MCNMQAENEMWLVNCTDSGLIQVKNKIDTKKSFDINLFPSRYEYLFKEWWAFPQIFLTPDSKYIIATYGIGYVYFIMLSEKKVVKFFRLFPEINYEDDSFESIDLCCYYNELTQVDFSNTGRYAAIRVRGDFDPQEAGGRNETFFTPVYFRSIFIIDLFNLEVCFYEDYSNVQEDRNLASISFSTNDNYIAMGALGNIVKIFHITSGECLGEFSSLVWISDAYKVRDCHLISFLDESNFVYINKDSDIIKVSLQENGQFVQSGIIESEYDKWNYIEKIELEKNEIICYICASYKKCQEKKRFKLCFDDINKK